MAETCIVCLGDLAPHDDVVPAAEAERHADTLDEAASPAAEKAPRDDELVAHLLPCGHNLHNECLKPWVERANSCPICRASFNMVELSAKVGSAILSSYAVQDKQQVAEIDPSMIVEEDYLLEDDGSYDACMVCDEFGDSSQLMYCHSCEQLCHVFCAGLDRMPSRDPWYCQGCIENPALLDAAAQRPIPRGGPAAFIQGRSRLPSRARATDEWVGIWQSVWDRLHFDIDFPFDDDDDQSDNRSEVQRRENDEWERRFQLARQMGAGTRFRAAADNVHTHRRPQASRPRTTNRALHREPPKTPKDPESREEVMAWNHFEKAREQLAQIEGGESPSNNASTRRRKRKSVDSTQADADPDAQGPQQPERKLKRPRTRLHIDAGESSATGARRTGPQEQATSPPTGSTAGDSSTVPGFLQSLLQEVAVDRFAEDREIAAPQPKRIIIERACSPQNSSPGLSPVYPTPHGMTTPPPLNLTRTNSPEQKDEQKSPTYSPFSPADDDARVGRRKIAHRHRSPGLTSPPRSKDSSPTRSASLSYSTKAELQRMVTVVLKPMYTKKDISKREYTEVNREVSRLMYDRVGDAGAEALADSDTRERWQKMASEEVDNSIKSLRANGPAVSADDSASTSP